MCFGFPDGLSLTFGWYNRPRFRFITGLPIATFETLGCQISSFLSVGLTMSLTRIIRLRSSHFHSALATVLERSVSSSGSLLVLRG
jgi:hypothetical protein